MDKKTGKVERIDAEKGVVKGTLKVGGSELTRDYFIPYTFTVPKDVPLDILRHAVTGINIAAAAKGRKADESDLTRLEENGFKGSYEEWTAMHVMTPAEKVARMVAAGMPEPLAKMAVEEPAKFQKLMKDYQ